MESFNEYIKGFGSGVKKSADRHAHLHESILAA